LAFYKEETLFVVQRAGHRIWTNFEKKFLTRIFGPNREELAPPAAVVVIVVVVVVELEDRGTENQFKNSALVWLFSRLVSAASSGGLDGGSFGGLSLCHTGQRVMSLVSWNY
jgi:hypothetical protein